VSAPEPAIESTLTLGQSLWDWLLGLSRIRIGGGDLSLGWQYPLPAWAWALIALLAVGLAGWSYHRLVGPRWARISLALVRAAVLLLIALLLAGPVLIHRSQQVEPDRLMMLVDRSASMEVQDLTDANGRPQARDAVLRQALGEQASVFQEPAMTEQRNVRWFGFGGQTFDMPAPSGETSMPPADRPATRLRTAIEQALAQGAGHRIAGLAILSDGQTPQDTGMSLVRQLNQRGVKVFSVPVGAKTLPMDLALTEVQAPERAFADDIVPISVTVDQLGGEQAEMPSTFTVELIDTATGETIDQSEVPRQRLGQSLRLTGRPETAGLKQYRIRVQPGRGPNGENASTTNELNTDNNVRTVSVEVIDRPLRVLYVEGYPRWEYRYLKNLLIREKSIESSILLLSASSQFAQEGDVPINRLPRNREELRRYDLIIIGDVAAGTFSDQQKSLLQDHVSATGAGLLWIGGPRHTPGDYAGSALADLLPVSAPTGVSRFGSANATITMQPTPLAQRLSVLRLQQAGEPTNRRGEATANPAWPGDLPPLRWVQQVGPLKPAAEVLATAREAAPGGRPLPLVMRMRYGSGQSLYVATDEIWRWRYGRGEVYFQQFWIQLLRMLGRGRVQQMAGPAQLETAHREIDLGQTTVVTLRLNDPALVSDSLNRVTVSVTPADEPDAAPLDTVTLRPTQDAAPDGQDSGRPTFEATWQPNETGPLLLSIDDAPLGGYDLTDTLNVVAPGDERAHPETDHERLRQLAKATGGQTIALNELDRLTTAVPNLAEPVANDTREPIWHSPLALILAMVLLTGEWIGRKLIRLV
jgi:hypothetical protein